MFLLWLTGGLAVGYILGAEETGRYFKKNAEAYFKEKGYSKKEAKKEAKYLMDLDRSVWDESKN